MDSSDSISDFAPADATLKALEQEINKYLMQFSSNSDFVSLNGFKANGQNETARLNILECDSKIVANHVKSHSSISVSPHHPSAREQHFLTKMINEVNTAKANAQQQIAVAQQNAQRDINSVRAQAQQDIAAAQRDKVTGIQAIRNEYKDADKTISGLRKELENANKEIARLSGTVNDLNVKAQNAEVYKRRYEETQKQLNKANAVIEKVRDNLSGLSGIAEVLGVKTNIPGFGGHAKEKEERDDKLFFMKIVRGIHPFTDFFVMIALLGIVSLTLPKSCERVEDSSKELLAANERIEQLERQLEEVQEIGYNQVAEPSLKERFPDARIDIAGISAQMPMKYGSDDTYIVSLKNVEGNLGGKWESSDFTIKNNKLIPKHTGDCNISYVVDGEVIVSRTITVTE